MFAVCCMCCLLFGVRLLFVVCCWSFYVRLFVRSLLCVV